MRRRAPAVKGKVRPFNFSISQELYDQVQALADQLDRSMSQTMRMIVQDFFDRRGEKNEEAGD